MGHFWHTIATAKPSLAASRNVKGPKNRRKLRPIHALSQGISETANSMEWVVLHA